MSAADPGTSRTTFLVGVGVALAEGEKANDPAADDGYLRCFASIKTVGAVAPTS
jgi:hypothetical protein